MYQHILVPLDGSALAETALPDAKALAAKFDAEITLVRATSTPHILADPDGASYADLMDDIRHQNLHEVEEYLQGVKSALQHEGFKVNAHLVENASPADAILTLAEEQNMDLIVMSTHGRGGLARWVYGSVADKVLRHSDVPIFLIRAKEVSTEIEPTEENETYKHTIGAF